MSKQFHPTTLISPTAEIGVDVRIGPNCYIGDRVAIGDGTHIGPMTVIMGPTVIGRNNRFTGQASVGTDPQDLKYGGEETFLSIGDDNVIREFVTLNRGTGGGRGRTTIGSGNLLMTGVHVGHDSEIGDRIVLANAATLAGHVWIGDDSTVGAFTGVHQFCRVGRYAFIGGYSVITRDALPFMKTVGIRGDAKAYGPNAIGLERKGFSKERVDALRNAFRVLFQRGFRLRDAIERLREKPVSKDVNELLDFVETAKRSFVR